MSDTAKCRSCGAPVLFVPSATTGALVCLNADPRPNGNYAIEDGKARVVKKGDMFDPAAQGPLYLSHHADCPSAAAWRKKAKTQ